MKSRNRTAWLAVLATVAVTTVLGATDSQAFRMIQNTGVGRFSAGSLVQCDDPGGFTHWNNANISWRLNTANQGGEAGVAAAVQNGMASWTSVGSANHVLTYAGTSTAGFVTDGINVLRWSTGEGCSGGCLALTALVLSAGQVITETDVTFNNSFNWNTNGSDYDVEAVAAHELGHTLGIHHTNLGGGVRKRPTMYATYFGTQGRSLQNDDKGALQCAQSHYPVAPQEVQQPAPVDAAQVAGPSLTAAAPVLRLASRPREGGALFRFALASEAQVKLQVFDVAGRLIATLVDGTREVGEHELAWNGTSRFGNAPSGVYFARLVTPAGMARATVILAE